MTVLHDRCECGGYWQTFQNGTFCQRCDRRKSLPRDLKCECGNEWTENVPLRDPNPACPNCRSEAVVRV